MSSIVRGKITDEVAPDNEAYKMLIIITTIIISFSIDFFALSSLNDIVLGKILRGINGKIDGLKGTEQNHKENGINEKEAISLLKNLFLRMSNESSRQMVKTLQEENDHTHLMLQ